MFSFIVYSTKRDSFIVPAKKFKCNSTVYKWTLDGDFEICTRRIKLPRYIDKVEMIDTIIAHLVEEVPNAKEAN